MISDAVEVSRFAKEAFGRSFPVVWGGVHPSLLPEQTLENENIDYLVVGEGELTFPAFLNELSDKRNFESVQGIAYKKDRRILVNERRPFIKNLDSLPRFRWDLLNTRKYFRQELTLVTSRGCPFDCGFCFNAVYNFRHWRGFSAGRVSDEIDRLCLMTGTYFSNLFSTTTILPQTSNASSIHGGMPLFYLWFESRADWIDEEYLSHLEKFKQVWIFIRVESGTQEMLDRMCKGITVDMIRRVFALLNSKENIQTTASVVLGGPSDTIENVNATMKLLKEIKPTRHGVCMYYPFPGSAFYEESLKLNLFKPPSKLEGMGRLHKFVGGFQNIHNER